MPGGGKSTMIYNLLCRPKFGAYYKRFERIYWWSRSIHTITKTINLPEDQIFTTFNEADIEAVLEKEKQEDNHVLFVWDDVLSDIKDVTLIQRIVWNRRHLCGKGLSLIVSIQIWSKLVLCLRKCADAIFFWSTHNKREITSFFNDVITIEKNKFDEIIKYVFTDRHNFLYLDVQNQKFYKNFNLLEFSSPL